VLDYESDVEILSTLLGAEFEVKFAGSGLFTNTLGGTVYTCCYPLGTAQFYMAYFNRVRQEYWTKVLFKMTGENSDQTIAAGHVLHVHAHNMEHGISIAATNVIYDPAESFSIKLPKKEVEGKTIRVLNAEAQWEVITPNVTFQGGVAEIQLKLALQPLQSAFITLQSN
jgi:hypothetical protein